MDAVKRGFISSNQIWLFWIFKSKPKSPTIPHSLAISLAIVDIAAFKVSERGKGPTLPQYWKRVTPNRRGIRKCRVTPSTCVSLPLLMQAAPRVGPGIYNCAILSEVAGGIERHT